MRHTLHRNEAGAAAVEMALVLPILILLVFGIVEFGMAYNAKNTLTHAAREGARAFAIADPDLAPADVEAAVRDTVEEAMGGLTIANPATDIDIDAPCTPGSPAEVTVSYDVVYDIPLWGTGTWSLSSTGSMRCSG